MDEPNLDGWSKDQRDYRGTYYAVLELKPTSTRSAAKVERIQHGGLIGLRVTCDNRSYTTLYNPGDASVTVDTSAHTPGRRNSVFTDRGTNQFARPQTVPATFSLLGKRSVLIVSGSDERLHQPGFIGWPSLLDAHSKNPSSFAPPP